MIEQKYIQTAIDYKKNVAGKFVPNKHGIEIN